MGKKTSDAVFDAALGHIQANATTMIICDAEPADRAEAIATALASVSVSSGDFTLSNGDVSGRKIRVAAKPSEAVDVTGTFNHVCLISATDLLVVSTAGTPRAVYSGDTVNLPAWDYEIADPQ